MTYQDQWLNNILLAKEPVHRLDMEQQVDKQAKFMVTWLLANGDKVQQQLLLLKQHPLPVSLLLPLRVVLEIELD